MDALEAFRVGSSAFSVAEMPSDSLSGASSPRHKGTPVLWPLGNSAQEIFTFLAALHEGVVPIVLPKTTKARLRGLMERMPGLALYSEGEIVAAPRSQRLDDEVFLALLTSGSTGEPKVVATTEERLVAGVRAIHEAQGLDRCQSTHAILPVAYSFAFVNQLLWSLLFERSLKPSSGLLGPAELFEQIRESTATMLCFVESQFRELNRVGLKGIDPLESVAVVNFAGAPFPVDLLPELRQFFPNARFYNNYGCTEAMPRIAIGEVVGEDQPSSLVGPAISGMKIRIDGARVGPIHFQGPSSAAGTLRADLTLEPFGAWIPSGDLGRLDADGTLHVLGRHDQIAKIAGARISFLEIEQKLVEFGVAQAHAWKSSSRECVVAAVSGLEPHRLRGLRAFIREELPREAWPKELYHFEDWPELANGKTDRQAIRRSAEAGEVKRLW